MISIYMSADTLYLLAYLRRKSENICFDASKDVRLDHIVQLAQEGFVEIGESFFQVGEVSALSDLAFPGIRRAYLKLTGSRKLSRLNNSRRLLLSGVPVNKIL